jgi:hypothetical protein
LQKAKDVKMAHSRKLASTDRRFDPPESSMPFPYEFQDELLKEIQTKAFAPETPLAQSTN